MKLSKADTTTHQWRRRDLAYVQRFDLWWFALEVKIYDAFHCVRKMCTLNGIIQLKRKNVNSQEKIPKGYFIQYNIYTAVTKVNCYKLQ